MQHYKHKAYLLTLVALICSFNLEANDGSYFGDSKRGWFWGEVKVIEKDEKKEELEEQPKNKNNLVFDGKEYKTIPNETKVPWKILDKLHPDEIVNLETETKNISVMYFC